MSDPVADVAATYRDMLARFVELGEEQELAGAYTLGRQSFADGMSLLELVDLHRRALLELGGQPSSPEAERLLASLQFLAEALGTFEMARRGYHEAQERIRLEQARADRERAVALSLQQDLLPASLPELPGYDVAIRYRPGGAASHAGGDWYDVVGLDERRAGFVVGDVTGHGVGAAAHMGQLRIGVLAYALAGFEPGQVVAGVDGLVTRLGNNELATLVYAVADADAQELAVVNAGHPPPLVVTPQGEVQQVDGGHGRLLGVRPPLPRREPVVVPFLPGHRLVLYTDGLIENIERRGADGIAYLAERVAGFTGSAEELCDLVLDRLAPHGSRDDICLVVADIQD